MSSSSSSGKTTIRYASYIETHHSNFLDEVVAYQKTVANDSPYADYNEISIEKAFFGIGYAVSSFPSLYDMYGKFMSGLDIDSLYKKFFGDIVGSSTLNSFVDAEAGLIDRELSMTLMPKFLGTVRNLNAVISSSFIIGKTAIEEQRIKLLAKFSTALKYELIPLVTEKWIAALNFKKTVVIDQAFILKLYLATKMYVDEVNYGKILKHYLWPFEVSEYERKALAAMRNMRALGKQKAERSGLSKGLLVASYTVQGAIIGSYFPPYGTVIGGAVGFVIGVAMIYLE